MKHLLTNFLTITLLFALCGCERRSAHTPPPVERLSLVIRFFNSIKDKDSNTAVIQGKKIFALDNTQNHVAELISIQESNSTVGDAQFYLGKRNVAMAQKVITDAQKKYPDNEVLKRSALKLRELSNAKKYFYEMDKARSSAAMSNARETMETGLSENMTPELIAYLEEYKKRENAVAQREQINTQAAMEAATLAAEKAKAEDSKREEENLRMQKEMSQLSQQSENMRRDAGNVPFEPEPANTSEKK